VLRLINEQPGITVREIAERLGVDPTGLYRVAKRLTDDGRVRKDGTRLFPTEPATAAAPASAEASAATAAQTTPESAPQPPQTPAAAEPESPTTDADPASSENK
jgi:DNA-binding IclR family transcriptional regulator